MLQLSSRKQLRHTTVVQLQLTGPCFVAECVHCLSVFFKKVQSWKPSGCRHAGGVGGVMVVVEEVYCEAGGQVGPA